MEVYLWKVSVDCNSLISGIHKIQRSDGRKQGDVPLPQEVTKALEAELKNTWASLGKLIIYFQIETK